MKEGLPKGWVRAVLREVTIPVSSVDPATQPTSEFAYIDISAINNQTFTIGEMKHFQGSEAPSRARRPVQQDDILFSNVRTYLRNIAHVDFPCARTLCSTGFTVLRPNPAIEPKFLFRFVLSDEFIDGVTPTQTGTHYPATSDAAVLSQEIALPPLPEQCRIVAKLEALLAKVDASRKRLERIPVILKRFRQAVLAAACDGRLTEDWRGLHPDLVSEQENPIEIEGPSQLPSTWNWVSSSQLFEFVTSGSRGWAQYYSDSGPIFIRVGNLNHDSIDLDLTSIQHVSPPRGSEGIRTRIRVGDILVSITADVGMIALVQQDLGEAYINQHVALARPSGNIDSNFLAWFLAAASGGQRQFGDLQRGATKVGLGLDDIRAIWVARPPRGEQEEIVRRISNLFFLADQIEARYAKAKAQVDRLTQSILAKAFRGELVPQDPNDEPADALLSRLGAAPAEASAPARRRGRPPRVQSPARPVVPASSAEDREAPALADLTPEAILQAHREVLASIPSPLSEDNLLRAVALRLGFQRLGSRIRGRISQALTHGDQPA